MESCGDKLLTFLVIFPFAFRVIVFHACDQLITVMQMQCISSVHHHFIYTTFFFPSLLTQLKVNFVVGLHDELRHGVPEDSSLLVNLLCVWMQGKNTKLASGSILLSPPSPTFFPWPPHGWL